jgi:pentatricopeptide repeat protein
MEPTIITYSATISACEKGRQWERALELFEEVKKHPRMEPNIITYNATISACGKGGRWERALELFEEVKKHPRMEPNIKTYNAILDALATTEPSHARVLYLEAVNKGFFNTKNEKRENGMPKLDLHGHSEGAAETATRWWLEEQAPSMKENKQLIIVTGRGKNRQMWKTSDINDRVRNVLHDMEVQILPQDNPGRLLIQYR